MRVEFFRTEMTTDTSYVDLFSVNGNLHTMLMEKIEEPNIYGIKEHLEGDHFDEMVRKYKNEI